MNENNITEIKELLERYYNGETNELEEACLRRYFAKEDVPEELLVEKEMFHRLSEAADSPVPVGLEERLSGAIDEWEAAERKAVANRKHLRPISFRAIIGLAASLVLVFVLGIFLANHSEPQELHASTDLTPEEAYQHTEKALLIFANALNKGVEGVETVNETSQKVQKQITTQLEQINNI